MGQRQIDGGTEQGGQTTFERYRVEQAETHAAIEVRDQIDIGRRGRLAASYRAMQTQMLSYAVLWLAPSSTAKAICWNCAEPTLDQMAKDLAHFEPSPGKAGGIQCMDTMSGCITVLSRMNVLQSTGFLYDCYLFAPEASATREAERRSFLKAIEKVPPALYVITDQWCFNLPTGYRKLAQWPAFQSVLSAQYQLVVQRNPPAASPKDLASAPFGYRVYKRHGVPK